MHLMDLKWIFISDPKEFVLFRTYTELNTVYMSLKHTWIVLSFKNTLVSSSKSFFVCFFGCDGLFLFKLFIMIEKGILKTSSLILPPTAITCSFLLLKSKQRLRSLTITCPTACLICNSSIVKVFLTMLASKMTRLFFNLKVCSVK